MNKQKDEVRKEILEKLATNIGINIHEEGSIALSIVDVIIDEIYLLYQELDYLKNQAYLSTSQGFHTELISELLNIERDENESDESLKLRTSTSVQTHAKGNKQAIEQAILSVPGVASMDYRTYGLGTGSFVVYIYPMAGYNQLRVLDEVEAVLEDVVSDGIYYEVKQPKELRVDLSLVVQFSPRVTQIEKQMMRDKVRAEIQNYINRLNRNDVLYINEIIQRSMNVSEDILDIEIMQLLVAGIDRQVSNTFPANDERFTAGDITIG